QALPRPLHTRSGPTSWCCSGTSASTGLSVQPIIVSAETSIETSLPAASTLVSNGTGPGFVVSQTSMVTIPPGLPMSPRMSSAGWASATDVVMGPKHSAAHSTTWTARPARRCFVDRPMLSKFAISAGAPETIVVDDAVQVAGVDLSAVIPIGDG